MKVRYVNFCTKRRFGIELEMDNNVSNADLARTISKVDHNHTVKTSAEYTHDYNNDYWHVKFDRSCSSVPKEGGWEVSSYVCSDWREIANLCAVAEALKNIGAKVNDNCAYHIHGEVLDFNSHQIAALVAWFTKIETILCEMVPPNRRDNKYCRLISRRYNIDRSRYYEPAQFWSLVRPRTFSNPERRLSLNMCNYMQQLRRTVELRLPEGTLDKAEIRNWIRFFLRFIDVAKRMGFPKSLTGAPDLHTLMYIVGLHSEDPFYILSQGLRDTKIWVLNRILRYSRRSGLRQEAKLWLGKLL